MAADTRPNVGIAIGIAIAATAAVAAFSVPAFPADAVTAVFTGRIMAQFRKRSLYVKYKVDTFLKIFCI